MNNKKAQIHMMETIAILLIFFVLAIMVFMLFAKTQAYGKQNKVEKQFELESIRVAQTISFLPELQCSAKNIIQENCFDTYKLDAFESLEGKETVYYNQLYYSTINVKKIYPIPTDTDVETWDLYNKPRQSTSYKTIMPISLYDPVTDKHSYGLLEIVYYTPE